MKLTTPRMTRNHIWIVVYSIIAIFGYNCSDYTSYKHVYEVLVPAGLGLYAVPDIGYDILCRIGSFLGVSFEIFRGLYLFAALILFYKGVCYFCDKPSRVFFCIFCILFFSGCRTVSFLYGLCNCDLCFEIYHR